MATNDPTLKAAFVLDAQGKPGGRTAGNYKIKLSIDGCPSDAYAVTYRLDPTYYDPVREALNQADRFSEEITSYGNYVITAKIRTKSYPLEIRRSLYDALMETYRDASEPSVIAALTDIKDN